MRAGVTSAPLALASASALGTTALMRQLKPGAPRVMGWAAGIGGGGFLALKSSSRNLRSLGVGVVMGSLWSMFVKT